MSKLLSLLTLAAGGYVALAVVVCPSAQLDVSGICTAVNLSDFPSCTLKTPQPLISTSIAELITSASTLSSDVIHFRIESEPYTDRKINSIQFGFDSAECAYPTSNNFTRSFDTDKCADVFEGDFTFLGALDDCDLQDEGNDGEYFIYTSYLKVTGEEIAGTLRGVEITRSYSAKLSVEILLPMSIEVSLNNLHAFSNVDLQAAISSVSFDNTLKLLNIKLATSVQNPYKVTSLSPSDELPISLGTASVSESCENGAGCQQEIAWSASLEGQCDFSGVYTFNVNYGCATSPCPTEIPSETLVFELDGSDACGKLSVLSSLGGSLHSYNDASFSDTRASFLDDDIAYFSAPLTSSVSIQSVHVDTLEVSYKGTTVVIVSEGSSFFDYFEGYTSDSNEARFSFKLSIGPSSEFLFNNFIIGPDASFDFTVTATISVQYISFFRKRDIEMENIKISQSFVFINPSTGERSIGEESSSSFVSTTFLSFVALLVAFSI